MTDSSCDVHKMRLERADFSAVLCSLLRKRLAEQGGGVLIPPGFSESDRSVLTRRDLPALPPAGRRALAGDFARFFGAGDAEDRLVAMLDALPDPEFWLSRMEDFWNASKQEICFSTSGSTGMPEYCKHSRASVFEEASAAAPYLAGAARLFSVMPAHHSYGFVFSLLLPRFLRVPAYFLPPVPTQSLFDLLRPGDIVVAFPLFLGALLQSRNDLPEGLLFMCSTAPCPEETRTRLRKQAFCLEIYGSSETGAVGQRSGEGAYELLPFWSRAEDAEGRFHLVRGGAVPSVRPYSLPDVLEWTDARRFLPLARLDRAVQVGGMNVYPERIAALLRAHPDIADCAVRLMRPAEGTRLKAFIVPVDMEPARLARLSGPEFRHWLDRCLESAARPRHFVFGTALPRGPSGKLGDWDIP